MQILAHPWMMVQASDVNMHLQYNEHVLTHDQTAEGQERVGSEAPPPLLPRCLCLACPASHRFSKRLSLPMQYQMYYDQMEGMFHYLGWEPVRRMRP